MARIKITDLPKDMKISSEEMKRVRGGIALSTSTLLKTAVFPKIDEKYDIITDHKIEDSAINLDLASIDHKWD